MALTLTETKTLAGIQKTDWIWKNGEFIAWDDAQIHMTSHVIHYGSSIFEGIRFYDTKQGPAVFRLTDHMRRFEGSAKIYRMELGYSVEQMVAACKEVVARNGIAEGYLRPVAIRGAGAMGLNPLACPLETYVITWPWGQYLGADALTKGVDACVSSWNRPAPNTHPSLSKAGGNYLNSQLMKMEAMANGYAEAIALGVDGTVSEGSGQNLFLVQNGALITPPLDGTMLHGITRDTVMRLAENLNIPVRQEIIPREALYLADEVFFVGTAAEISPVTSIDRITIGEGTVGPISRALQEEYLGVARGERPDRHGWLEYAPQPARAAV